MGAAEADPSALREVAVEAAREAGALVRARFGIESDYALKSGPQDLVTEADHAAERRLLEIVAARFPEHGILAEESAPTRTDAPIRWVIDPIDGTTNFAHGVPFISVSIAVETADRTLAGVVYDPLLDELFAASCDDRARVNGRPMEVSKVERLDRALLATGFPHRAELRDRNADNFRALLPQAQGMRRLGSAALALAYVAAGRLDGYWDLDLSRWDLAAGVFLVEQATGRVTDTDGEALGTTAGNPIASNGWLHEALVERITGPT